jgi:SAM-dependent methyltransferase
MDTNRLIAKVGGPRPLPGQVIPQGGPVNAAELAQAHWNKAPLYFSEEERYREYPWLCEAAEFRYHAGERVLEVGCGSGCDLLQFAKHGAIATGVDITERHIELARQRVAGLAAVQYGSACELPFGDDSFDYVYSHGVFHHIDTPELAVRELLRVLRPGGRFNVHVYALWSESAAIYFLKHGRDWKRHVENSADPVHIQLYTGRSLRRLFAPVPLDISKHQSYHLPALSRCTGFFLVAKGRKP